MKETKRKMWVDAAKGLAILAVAANHYPYLLPSVMPLSFFSVTLLVFVSGYNVYGAVSRRGFSRFDAKYAGKSLWRVVRPYMLACLVVWFLSSGSLDLFTMLHIWAGFTLEPPHYFVAFFLQLVLISQPLHRLASRCAAAARPHLACLFSFAAVVGISVFCWRHTTTFPLYGGGAYLFGASYLAIYYLGMLFSAMEGRNVFRAAPAVSAAVALVVCGYFISFRQELFFRGDLLANPPGLTLSLYGVAIFILARQLFAWLETRHSLAVRWPLAVLSWCGRYSMTIFLYHFVVLNHLLVWVLMPLMEVPFIAGNAAISLTVRVLGYLVVVILPAAGGMLAQWLRQKARVLFRVDVQNL